MTAATSGVPARHFDPAGKTTHETQFDREYGIAAICGKRGEGLEWAETTDLIDCEDCLAYRLIEALRGAIGPVRQQLQQQLPPTAAVPLVVIGRHAHDVLHRSPLAFRLIGTSMAPMVVGQPPRLFGAAVVTSPDYDGVVPTWGWQVYMPVKNYAGGELRR